MAELSYRERKLRTLLDIEGVEDQDEDGKIEFWTRVRLDSHCPGICMNPGCHYTVEVEPDQREGWCDECGTDTVKSALILAEMI